MYLRVTILLLIAGGGAFFLMNTQHQSQPQVINNPYVAQDQSTASEATADSSWPSWLAATGNHGWQPWHFFTGGLVVIALAVAAMIDCVRGRRQPDERLVYHTPTPLSPREQTPPDANDETALGEDSPEQDAVELTS